MRRTLIVEVTADDIKNGKPQNACECPVARAIKRVFPSSNPYINADGLEWRPYGALEDWPITDEALDFLDLFDSGELVVEPRTLVVCRVDDSQEDEL